MVVSLTFAPIDYRMYEYWNCIPVCICASTNNSVSISVNIFCTNKLTCFFYLKKYFMFKWDQLTLYFNATCRPPIPSCITRTLILLASSDKNSCGLVFMSKLSLWIFTRLVHYRPRIWIFYLESNMTENVEHVHIVLLGLSHNIRKKIIMICFVSNFCYQSCRFTFWDF